MTIRSLQDLPATTAHAWQALAECASVDNPFNSHGFAVAAAAHLPGGGATGLLTAQQGDDLIFALPVRRGRDRSAAVVAWQHDYAYLCAPLVAAGQEVPAWATVLNGLRQSGSHLLILPSLPADGTLYTGLIAAATTDGVRPYLRQVHERAVVRRRALPDYLDGRMRGTHRKGLRRQRRRLSDLAGADVRTVDRTGDPGGIEAFLHLEQQGWKGRAGTAMAARAGHADFLRALQQRWPDRVHVLALEAAGRQLAIQVSLRAGRTLSCFKTTYDERFASCSPGLLLELDVLTAFHDDSRVDLLDSCAVAGHTMAERLFADRRPLVDVAVPLSRGAGLALRGAPYADRQWSRWRHRSKMHP